MVLRSLFAAAALTLVAGSAAAQTAAPAPAPAAAAPAPTTTTAPAAAGGFTQVAPKGTIIQTLRAAGQFNTLLKVLDMAGLSGPALLGRTQPITLFAPTDAAFAAMPAGELNQLMQPANSARLQTRFAYLIFNGPLEFSKLDGKSGPISGAGGQIYVDASAKPGKVNDATLLQADVKATNGNIYIIDKVIGPGYTPPAPAAEPDAAPAAQ